MINYERMRNINPRVRFTRGFFNYLYSKAVNDSALIGIPAYALTAVGEKSRTTEYVRDLFPVPVIYRIKKTRNAMDESVIRQVERELRVKFPEYYRDVLKKYPFSGYAGNDFIRDCIMEDEEWLITENRELRENGFIDQKWPDYLLAIGHDDSGGYYFINLEDDDDTRIYLADHESLFDYRNIDELEIGSDMDDFVNYCKEVHDADA